MKQMVNNPLVSILTPCYNTGHLIHHLLDSILSQDYSNIEMFVIDDGSIDNTSEVVRSYQPKFEEKGYKLTYIYQNNGGQSVAINNGLKLITGEYLVWPDSDDFYASNTCISQMVEALESASSEFAMVRTQEQIIDEQSGNILYYNGLKTKEQENRSLFEDCLYDKNYYYFCPGAYMVKVKALYETTQMQIYTEKDAGQNWQLMLPILYKYRCLTIKEVLYTVLARSSSHSRGQYRTYEEILKKYDSYERTIQETLDRIVCLSPENRNFYKVSISVKYLRIRILNDFIFNHKDALRKHLYILKTKYKKSTISDNLLLLAIQIRLNKIALIQRVINRFYNKVINDYSQQ